MIGIGRRLILGLAGAAVFCSGLGGPAFAHRLPYSLTDVEWREDGKSLQIIHELHVHDAEQGLALVLNEAGLMLADLETRAKLALYIEEHFVLKDGEGHTLPLTIIGAEVEGDHVFVYQEGRLETLPPKFVVECTILRGVVTGQANQVNLRQGNTVRTIVFRGDDEAKELQF